MVSIETARLKGSPIMQLAVVAEGGGGGGGGAANLSVGALVQNEKSASMEPTLSKGHPRSHESHTTTAISGILSTSCHVQYEALVFMETSCHGLSIVTDLMSNRTSTCVPAMLVVFY